MDSTFLSDNSSHARATLSATAPGSVQPKAGFTSSFRNSFSVNIRSHPFSGNIKYTIPGKFPIEKGIRFFEYTKSQLNR
jgi:hypothetical protein